MSSVETATAAGAEKSGSQPVGMVGHLKHLIESLPVCVMRSDLDGCLLAVNDSALHLLGITEHAKVLSKSLNERISAEHLDEWRAFLQRGWSDGASSFECELIDFAGAHRVVLFKSVAQPGHFDGIPSLILTAQDLAARRRLERALNEHQGCATTIDALQTELQLAEAERQKLVALVETLQGSGTEPPEQQTAVEALKQQIAELEAAIQSRDAEQRQLSDTHAHHEAEHRSAAEALQQRISELEAALAEKDHEHQQVSEMLARHDAEHQAAGETLQRRLAELQQTLTARDEEWKKRCDDLMAAVAEHQRGRIQSEAAQQANGETLQQRIADLERTLQNEGREWHKRAEEADAQLAALAGERDQLQAQLDEQGASHKQLAADIEQREATQRASRERLEQRIGELERSIITNDEEWRKRCDDLTAQLAELTSDRERLSAQLTARDSDRHTTAAPLQQRIDTLEQTLKASEAEWLKRRDELAGELDRHVAERDRLAAVLAQRDGEEQRMFELLKEGEAEQQRLTALVKAHESEVHRLSQLLQKREDEHQATVDALQQQIEECERALSTNDESWKQRCDELASQLSAKDEERRARWESLTAQVLEHVNERQRLTELVEQQAAEQQRLAAVHAAEKSHLEQTARSESARARSEIEGRQREIETLKNEMRRLAEDLQQTAAQLAQRTAEYERLTADLHERQRDAIDPADVQRLMKSVAAYRVELVQVTENTIRTLEPMATAGRVAMASSRELQAAVEAVDERSRQLLAQAALDDPNRAEIERLRRDSIAAASLVRQLLQVFGDIQSGAHHARDEASAP
jgi:chromosome segregation ATPase